MSGMMDQRPTGSPVSSAQKPKVPVNIESFLLGFKVPFDVFSKDTGGFSCVLRKWTKFDQNIKNSLKAKGVTFLYVEGDPTQVKEFFSAKPSAAAPVISAPKHSDAEIHAAYSKNKDQFHHVSKLIFSPGTRVNFSIYNMVNMQFRPVLETSADRPVQVTDTVKTAEGSLAIKISDMKLFRDYVFALSKAPAADQAAFQSRIAGIKENAKMSIRDFLSEPGNAQNLTGVVTSANQIISVLKRKEVGLNSMLSLNAHDLHIYNHCSNVAVLSAALALAMGLDQAQIEKLAVGAMTHDVGKRNIPSEIMNKRDGLSNEEFSAWKKHVNDGISLLQNNGLPRDAIVAVQQHHERISGSGYPYGLSGKMILPFGRILSVVDCYDSLTTRRPFRQQLTPFMALEKILRETNDRNDFDPEVVKLLVKVLKGQGRL